jgi:hypothetical protein
MSAIEALAAAKAAGVKLILDGDGIVLEAKVPPLPADVVALLKAAKPDLMRVLEWREAAFDTAVSSPPSDCADVFSAVGIRRWMARDPDGSEKVHAQLVYGAPQNEWATAIDGLKRFVVEGWGDQACLLGWSKAELYRRPWKWAHVHLTGAALLIGDRKIIAVTGDNIVVKTQAGSILKFRRIGREHLA